MTSPVKPDHRETCWRCRGDGYYWRVPDGFNPFYAGARMTARVSQKIQCREPGCSAAVRILSDDEKADS